VAQIGRLGSRLEALLPAQQRPAVEHKAKPFGVVQVGGVRPA
jgi:hypothetical protein